MAFELDTFVHFLLAAVTSRSIASAPRPHPSCKKTAYSQPRLTMIYSSCVGRISRWSRLSRSPVIQWSSCCRRSPLGEVNHDWFVQFMYRVPQGQRQSAFSSNHAHLTPCSTLSRFEDPGELSAHIYATPPDTAPANVSTGMARSAMRSLTVHSSNIKHHINLPWRAGSESITAGEQFGRS
jgi:hypothetical protein